MPADRRRVVVIAVVAAAAALLFAWATWALFLAPRKGGDTIEAFLESIAEKLRDGDLDGIRDRLEPGFTLDPAGLDREAALAVAANEFRAGRLFPYIAMVHSIPGGTEDVQLVAVLGILAQGNPERMRDVNVIPVRLEVKVRKAPDGFRVVSARSHLGR